MNQEQNPDLTSVRNKLDAVRRDIEATTAQAQRRTRVIGAFVFILVFVIAGYLTFAYKQITRVDSQMLVRAAQSRVQASLPDARDALAKQLIDQAPPLMDEMEKLAFKGPAQIRDWVVSTSSTRIHESIAGVEADLLPSLKQQMTALTEKYADVPEEQRTDAVMEEVADTFARGTTQAIDQAYAEYHDEFTEVVDYLTYLGTSEELDEGQKIQKQMIQTAFYVLNQYDSPNANRPSVQDVLERLPDNLPRLEPE